MGDLGERLTIKIEKDHPLDLLALTSSLAAIGDEYRRVSGDDGARLYVESISEGSVLAYLVGAVASGIGQVAPLVPIALDTVAPFMGHWSGLLNSLANYGRDRDADAKAKEIDRGSLKNAKAFVGPAMEGNNITVTGDNANLAFTQIVINSQTAGDITRNADHLLAGPIPDQLRFENEPLILYQMRDAKAGDLGYIDRFDAKPKRLSFASEDVKHELLHQERPFNVFFFVSGYAKTAGGTTASYHIERIDGVTEKDAA